MMTKPTWFVLAESTEQLIRLEERTRVYLCRTDMYRLCEVRSI